jgi:hypothetical protein
MSFKKSTGGVFAACLLATLILGCSPPQSAELEPLPETIVNDLTTREKALWDASQQKDTKRLKQLLADEYVAVSDRGPLDKAGAIAYLRERNITEYSLRDVRATLLGNNSVLLNYVCSAKGDLHGIAFYQNYLCSDIWINRGGSWQSIFFADRPIGQ